MSPPTLITNVRDWGTRAHRFFSHDVWNVELEQLPSVQAFRYRCARILHCTVRSLFFEDTIHVRAAALTYFTVLSLVPLLAFAFALLKGFGAYDALMNQTIIPYMLDLLEGNDALRSAFERVIGFVDQTGVASLGFLGLISLLYAATRLLHNIEAALNELWGARSSRDALAQLRDYVAIIVVTPLCLMAAATLTTLGQVADLLRAAGETLGVSGLLDRLLSLVGPLTVLFLGLLFLYIVLPTTRVRARSAALGAAVGSVIWYALLVLHVRFQVGVARFNALYSSFAAFPIFLAWVQISWVVVLGGARIAAADQNHPAMAQRARMAAADQALKEEICLSAALRIVRAFLRGLPQPTHQELSVELDTPEDLLATLLDRLVQSGILVRTSAPKASAYTLARPPETIYVKNVLDALRRSASTDPSERDAHVDPDAARVWQELDRSLEQSPANRSLLDLARLQDRKEAA